MSCGYFVLAVACALQGAIAEAREYVVPALRGGSHGRRAEDDGRNSTLSSASAVAAGGDPWDLNYSNGPWCEPDTVSGRKSPQGWDPCCFWLNDGCDIRDAVFQADGGSQGKGQWCTKSDWDQYGSCWNTDTNSWNFWTGGYLYDTCECNDGDYNCERHDDGVWSKQECIATFDDGQWWDWQDCSNWPGQTDPDNCWKYLMEAKCNTDQSADVCYAGFIDWDFDTGACGDQYRLEWDDYSQLNMCIPNW